jgi:hypothetical protein
MQELIRVDLPDIQKPINSQTYSSEPADASPLSFDIPDDPIFDEDMEDRLPADEDTRAEPVEEYPHAAATFGLGQTFMDRFDDDVYTEYRTNNLYYPFATRQDWEIGNFLERSSLSMSAIDEFLSLEVVCAFPSHFPPI